MQHEEAIQEVTRLQAEYTSLLGEHEDLIEKFNNQQSETTRLKAEVAELKDDVLSLGCIIDECGKERASLQAELTKARELLGDVAKKPWMYDVLGSVREYLSNQSAPADKAPPVIQALHANGDRIAMEATIAQQAQRIVDLEADKGQGEPVAYRCRHSATEPWFFSDKPGYWEWQALYAERPEAQ